MSLKRLSRDEPGKNEPPAEPPSKDLERVLQERLIQEQTPKPRCVVFVDMLGFSQLTEDHPNDIDWNFGSTEITSATSQTEKQIGAFQHALNTIAGSAWDAFAPSHLMAFSDCAFLVYDNPLQAALSARQLMQLFFQLAVPVRMGMAFGTWHVQRFSFDAVNQKQITRAVFYGTAVVRAHNAERHGGKGCRIFVHSSIDAAGVEAIKNRVAVMTNGTCHPDFPDDAPLELNYLHEEDLDEMAKDNDVKHLLRGYQRMFSKVKEPIKPEVEKQYQSTLEALDRMRQQLSRPRFIAPL